MSHLPTVLVFIICLMCNFGGSLCDKTSNHNHPLHYQPVDDDRHRDYQETLSSSLDCWKGSSHPRASSGYPPELVACPYPGAVCSLTSIQYLDLYTMDCMSKVKCERMRSDFESGVTLTLYDLVECCDSSGCNADPSTPLPSSASTPSSHPASFFSSIKTSIVSALEGMVNTIIKLLITPKVP